MVSWITALGVSWTGLPHSPKTDRDRLIKDNLDSLDELDDLYRSSDCGGVPSIRFPML